MFSSVNTCWTLVGAFLVYFKMCIRDRFNSVYGETLVEPQIVLPQNAACLRLPGIDGKARCV